jgi:antitoxin ParD1/3/4
MATMNISLPDKLKDFVEERVAEGRYSNASDFMRDLIRKDQERQAAVSEIQQALDEGEASGFVPFVREDVERRLDELAKSHRLGKKNAA